MNLLKFILCAAVSTQICASISLAQTVHKDVGGNKFETDVLLNTLKVEHTNGGAANVKINCVSDDTDSGVGTQVLTGVIPAGAVSLAVHCYVNTVIAGAGATTFDLGDGTDADLYGTGIAFAAGTTVDHSDYTASPMTQAWSSSAGDLTMTADAGQFDSGNITCCSVYVDTSAPTS